MGFIDRVEANLEGVQFFSVGPCPGCESCGLEDVTYADEDPEAYELASGSHFSWRACPSCGSTLGGDRHPAHGVIAETVEAAQAKDRDIEHFNVCTDCLMFHANGDIPAEGSEK